MKYSTSVILVLFFSISLYGSGTQVDSITAPKLWLEQQNELGERLLKSSHDFKEAVDIYKSAYNFAVSNELSSHLIDLTVNYGIALYKNGEIQEAYSILHDVLPKIINDNLKLKADVNQILGMTLVFQNKFSEGYKHQMDALKYYTDMKDSSGVMSVFYDLGNNFATQGQSELALENYEKGIAIAKSLEDVKMTMFGITALGGAWAALGDLEKALKYSNESIDLAKLLKDDEELAWASINQGHILVQLAKYEDAEVFLQQAYDLSFVIGNKLLTGYSIEQMAELKFRQNHLEEAIQRLDESYKIYQELGHTNSVKEVTKKYAEIYFKQKNYIKYKEYTDQYIALKDSLYSKEMMESMASLKQDFEYHKMERENQIVLLTKDQELAQAKGYIICAIVLGTSLVFILLLILLFSRNKAANEKNEILRAKNAEILRQNESLVSSNEDLEKFAYIISHDLKEPLRNINGFTKLLSRKLKKYSFDDSISEYLQFIVSGTDQMGDLLTGLLDYSKVGVNKSEKQLINLDSIARKVINGFRIQIAEKNCEIELHELPKVSCKNTQLSQVFQNLLANAIKFGQDQGNKIIIGAKDLGDEYQIFVKDEGIGIERKYQEDIFVVFKRLHDRKAFTGSGIGLATCKKIVEDHGGRIWVKSEEGKGSCFYFTLPKIPLDDPQNPTIEKINTSQRDLVIA